jgi:hypothetical protein
MITLHITSLVLNTIGDLIKAILLLLNRKETFKKFHALTTTPIKILLITGILAGIYMVVNKFGGIIPPWLIIKLTLFAVGGGLTVLAEKKENKYLLTAGVMMLILVIVQANVKFS